MDPDSPVVEVITLPDRGSLWERLRREIAEAGFEDVRRADAVDGRALGFDKAQSMMTPRAVSEMRGGRGGWALWSHEGIPTMGAVGCYLSHLDVWRRASERDGPTLVLEEDAALIVTPDRFREAVCQAPPDAGLAVLGHFAPFPLGWLRPRLSDGFHPLGPRDYVYGSHAYLLRPSAARKLVELALPMNAQVDSHLRFLSDPVYGIPTVYHSPTLVRQLSERTISTTQPSGELWANLRTAFCASAAAFRYFVLWILDAIFRR